MGMQVMGAERESTALGARCACTPRNGSSAGQASVRSNLKAATDRGGLVGAGGLLLALLQRCCDLTETYTRGRVVGLTQLFTRLKYLVLFLEHPRVQVQSRRAGERREHCGLACCKPGSFSATVSIEIHPPCHWHLMLLNIWHLGVKTFIFTSIYSKAQFPMYLYLSRAEYIHTLSC